MMDFVIKYPLEVALSTLSWLDPPSLATCTAVSQAWRALVDSTSTWRKVAYLHGYALPTEGTVEAVVSRIRYASTAGYYDDVTTWRDLCRKQYLLDRSWSGPGEVKSTLKPRRRIIRAAPESRDVWRIKLDPVEQTLISTGIAGGVRVVDVRSGELLWAIPASQTRSHPHLEFSDGWMIFDRHGLGHFEIFKSERLVEDLGREAKRGAYVRHTILTSPRPIRAYRFQYPYLAAGTLDSGVIIWHVPDNSIVQTIDLSNTAHRDTNINYIDFDDEYVFLVGVGAWSVTIFSRETGQVVWSLRDQAQRPERYVHVSFFDPTRYHSHWDIPKSIRDAYGLVADDDGRGHLVEPSDLDSPTGSGEFSADDDDWTDEESGESATGFRSSQPAHPDENWLPRRILMDEDIVPEDRPDLSDLPFDNMMDESDCEWTAIHPDPVTRTLIAVSTQDILLIRDYKRLCKNPSEQPEVLATVCHTPFSESLGESQKQLAVFQGRAYVLAGYPILIDLRQTSEIVKVPPLLAEDRVPGTEPAAEGEEGPGPRRKARRLFPVSGNTPDTLPFAVFGGLGLTSDVDNFEWEDSRSLRMSSCVQMDGTAAYAVFPSSSVHDHGIDVRVSDFAPA